MGLETEASWCNYAYFFWCLISCAVWKPTVFTTKVAYLLPFLSPRVEASALLANFKPRPPRPACLVRVTGKTFSGHVPVRR